MQLDITAGRKAEEAMSGEREAVEARAEQWMLEHGYRCAGVPLHYETESHVGYQYPHEFATEFSLAENAELLGRVKRAEQECDDWKMDVASRDKKVEAVQAKYETAMVDLCTAIQRAEAAEAEVVKLKGLLKRALGYSHMRLSQLGEEIESALNPGAAKEGL